MIAFLVGSRFPDHPWLRDPTRPRVRRFKENAPELPEEQRRAAVAELETYEAELSAKSVEEVRVLYDAERRQQAEEVRRKRRARAEAEERGRFFNNPRADADFVHWSKAAYWTVDEGVALLLGKSPDVVNSDSVRDYTEVSAFAHGYAKLRDLARRSQDSGQLARRIEPPIFLEWAKRIGIEYPYELGEKVMSTTRATRAEAVADPPQAPPQKITKQKPLSVRERDTVLKMLGGIALKRYGYNPKAVRNAAITAIVADLDAAGVHVDADTVRKWIREAADNMPPEAFEDPHR
jgi:hypothetical protein